MVAAGADQEREKGLRRRRGDQGLVVPGYRPWRGEIMRAELRWPESCELLVPARLSMPRSFWVFQRVRAALERCATEAAG